MSSSSKISINFYYALSVISILCLPFISIPIFPSSYRPLSLVPISIISFGIFLGFFYFKKNTLNRDDLFLFAFLLFSFCNSLIQVGIKNGDWVDFFLENTLLVLGIFGFLSFRWIIGSVGIDRILLLMRFVALALIFLGVFELLCLYGPLPIGWRDALMSIINGQASSRLQLTTSEPAWAARVFLPLLAVYGFGLVNARIGFKHIVFCIGVLVYGATFSAEGYIILLISIFTYLVLFARKIPYKKIAIFCFLSSMLVWVSAGWIESETQRPDAGYYLTRINKLNDINALNLFELAQIDESIFIRINYPLISWKVFFDNKLTGVGNGQYDNHFPLYLDELGRLPWQNDQVVADVVNGTGDPRNLFGRILAENGLIGFFPFLGFLVVLWSKLRRLDERCIGAVEAKALFAVSLAGTLQFGSLLFLQNWFSWALASSVFMLRTGNSSSCRGQLR